MATIVLLMLGLPTVRSIHHSVAMIAVAIAVFIIRHIIDNIDAGYASILSMVIFSRGM